MQALLQYLLEGTRGGPTRTEILRALKKRPRNVNQLSEDLKLDYKTIQHHIRMLEEHQIILPITARKYAKSYQIAPYILEIWVESG